MLPVALPHVCSLALVCVYVAAGARFAAAVHVVAATAVASSGLVIDAAFIESVFQTALSDLIIAPRWAAAAIWGRG